MLVLLPAAFMVLISLGTWQVKRLYWKQDLLAAIEQRSHAEPVAVLQIEAMDQVERTIRVPQSLCDRAVSQ